MTLNELKITIKEINENNVKSAADTYDDGDVRSNKNIFDRLPELIAARLNRVIDRTAEGLSDVCTEEQVKNIIDEAMVEAGAGDMTKARYDSDNNGMVDKADNGIHIYNHSKSGTVHSLTGSGAVAKFVTSRDWNPGDSLQVNGLPAYPYNQLAENIRSETIFKKNVVVFCFVEKVGERYNCFFKRGGLSETGLAKADAAEGDVRAGKTFYAGDKTLRTGTWAGGAAGSFTSIYNLAGENKVVTVDVGFAPTVIMATYAYDSNTAGHTVILYDQSKPDTYRLWYGAYEGTERPREKEDNFGYIEFTETGFTFRGYHGSSGNKLVNYVCY